MSEVKHKYLDFTKKVNEIGFFVALANITKGNSTLSFSEDQFKILLAEMFTFKLFRLSDKKMETKDVWSMVNEHKLPLVCFCKRYALHLLNSVEGDAKVMFEELIKPKYPMKGLFYNNKLKDYVDLVLIDPTFSYRSVEFGRFTIMAIAEHLFDEKERSILEIISSSKRHNFESYLKAIGEDLDRSNENIYYYEKYLIGFALIYQLQPSKLNIKTCLQVSEIIQENLLSLNNRLDFLKGFYKKNVNRVQPKNNLGLNPNRRKPGKKGPKL